jgi:hypothetical protein
MKMGWLYLPWKIRHKQGRIIVITGNISMNVTFTAASMAPQPSGTCPSWPE